MTDGERAAERCREDSARRAREAKLWREHRILCQVAQDNPLLKIILGEYVEEGGDLEKSLAMCITVVEASNRELRETAGMMHGVLKSLTPAAETSAPPKKSDLLYSWLVVICREGETTALPFNDEASAREYYNRAGAQWSDSYLCKVVEGPKV